MILVIDNYDSFTYNLVQYLGELGADPLVRRNDEIGIDEVATLAPRGIVLSPGPGTPSDAGITMAVVSEFGSSIPTLGVCLGHQAIAQAYGGRVVRAQKLMHGKTSLISHDGAGIFEGLASPLEVMRYHSLTVEASTIPEALVPVAWSIDDRQDIHALKHRVHPVWGVQFHPESVMTEGGTAMLANFLRLTK